MYCWWALNSFAICSFRAAAKDCSAIGPPVEFWVAAKVSEAELFGPAEAGGYRGRLQRAGGEPIRHARVVVAGRRDVVRRVGMEDRRQVLDLLAADPELALSAAVNLDSLALAVLIHRHELLERAEARGL